LKLAGTGEDVIGQGSVGVCGDCQAADLSDVTRKALDCGLVSSRVELLKVTPNIASQRYLQVSPCFAGPF
jgi:hypothetical protein